MFGHDWQSAQAAIVATRRLPNSDPEKMPQEYIADVKPLDLPAFRATFRDPWDTDDFWQPDVGDVVKVRFDPKTHKVKFDKSDPQLSYQAHKRAQKDHFESIAQAALGTSVSAPPSAEPVAPSVQPDGVDELARLARLRPDGALTPSEFEQQKQRILGSI